MKLKTFFNQHVSHICIILFVLFMVKSCQSCSRQRQIEWTKAQYEIQIDSLIRTIDSCSNVIYMQSDSINRYKFEMGVMEDNNNMLKGITKHFQTTNKTLIDTNKKLTNKEE